MLLAVDRNICRASGWARDSKYAAVTGWSCTDAAGFILAGLLIHL
ncbi:hypothetical protein [Paenibacillus sp. FSL R7-0331]|nr:hypothetical protein [Paenibacillus sp. FSL R7-0331]